ncbi:MAG: hypothetical protein JOS17DRAFT_726742 [Linnemannia elongata]|nr:MAG: hypothetical protein JOS17DRAFT_726742 [Linnemannia elongata]
MARCPSSWVRWLVAIRSSPGLGLSLPLHVQPSTPPFVSMASLPPNNLVDTVAIYLASAFVRSMRHLTLVLPQPSASDKRSILGSQYHSATIMRICTDAPVPSLPLPPTILKYKNKTQHNSFDVYYFGFLCCPRPPLGRSLLFQVSNLAFFLTASPVDFAISIPVPFDIHIPRDVRRSSR